MAEYQNLQATINAVIKANGVQAITGPVLNAVLNSMVTVLGDGYRFGGVATPADNPGSPDNRVAYLASQDGTYTNFGGLTLSGEVALLCWDSAWTKETLFSIDAAPTPGSDNLISSGAVDTALTNLANSIAAAYMQLVPAAVEDHLASYDSAGQVKDSGLAAGDVVLKGGAYLGLFAGYAANLVDTRSAGTPQGPYAFRQSGGDGVDYMVRIKGRTEAFNQLGVVRPAGSSSANNVTGTFDTDGNLTIVVGTGGATGNWSQPLATHPDGYITGHKYLLAVRTDFSPSASTVQIGNNYYQWWNNAAYVWTALGNLGNYSVQAVSGCPAGTYHISAPIIVDLTLMYGAGNEPTAAQFQSLHPLPYYAYNAGVLKNNAATGIKTTGFNQWDEEYEVDAQNRVRSKNYIKVIGGSTYYLKMPNTGAAIDCYDANYNSVSTIYGVLNNTFTVPSGASYIKFVCGAGYGATYNHDICVNLSDASRNGTYEPYWERTLALGLNSLACHDENNNAVTLNGLDGVGSSYDEAVVENGMVTKIVKRFAEVDLGSLSWSNSGSIFISTSLNSLMKMPPSISAPSANGICDKYGKVGSYDEFYNKDKVIYTTWIGAPAGLSLRVNDSAYSDAATFKAAMSGVKLRYELATPKVLTVDTPFPALIEVDNLGTEERLPADTAADPQAPFECDSNYSVSTANLVRALGL